MSDFISENFRFIGIFVLLFMAWRWLTAEIISMHSRRGEYVPAGMPYQRNDVQVQFDARYFF